MTTHHDGVRVAIELLAISGGPIAVVLFCYFWRQSEKGDG